MASRKAPGKERDRSGGALTLIVVAGGSILLAAALGFYVFEELARLN